MNGSIPCIVQYQGSKRILAPQIMEFMPAHYGRLVEPFSGMASISIASAYYKRTDSFLINDINEPLIEVLRTAVDDPDTLSVSYEKLWNDQFAADNHVDHYYDVRKSFNEGDRSPELLLYLIARCVKGSVRYGKNGQFNQSPDKRRHGTNPKNMSRNIHKISALLSGRTEFQSTDYRRVLDIAQPGDLVYMDPPYQGVSSVRDNRYYSGLSFDAFVDSLYDLNERGIDFIISYDGACGSREYGSELPSDLNCARVLLDAGRSAQSTLLGKEEKTFESLYISQNLSRAPKNYCQTTLTEVEI